LRDAIANTINVCQGLAISRYGPGVACSDDSLAAIDTISPEFKFVGPQV
jgi:hypothetical protein